MINPRWINYLAELKKRLFLSVIVFLCLFVVFFSFHKSLFSLVALPLLNVLPHSGRIIATTVTAPFIVPIQLSTICALIAGMPFYLYQLWAFLMPALYHSERKLVIPLTLLGVILFLLGLLFAFFVFLPLAFRFLLLMTPSSVQIMTDMSAYLDFIIRFGLTFGLSFQVPVILLLIIKSGVVSVQSFEKKRPHVIIAAFVLGMLLTPPDVVSQVILALPLWGLFELGILLAKTPWFQFTEDRS